eukprot:symbB.v1.2.018542.t1/scaffold1479.1/size116273/1
MLEIHNAFYTENSYKQHLWSKMGTEGHPNRMQLDAWELRAYLVPHGQKPYPLWDQATDKIKYVDPASSGDGVLHRAQAGGGGCVKLIEKQLQKMRKRLLEGPKPKNKEGEGGEEEAPESDGTVSGLSVQSDYNVYRDLVDVSDEEAVREKTSKRLAPTSKAKAIEKSKESKAKKEKDPRPPLPRRKEEKEEKKEDERPPLERKVPAKGKGKSRYEGDDSKEQSPAKPMSSRPSKSVRSDDVIGFTPGAVAVFSQNFVFQRLEEIKQLENAYALLADNNPAKKHLKETIDHLKKEVEDLKAEKAKSKPAQ